MIQEGHLQMDWLDWIRWPFVAVSDTQRDVRVIRRIAEGLPNRFTQLGRLIMATAEQLVTAFNAATDEVAADLEDLREQLRLAVADKDQAVQDAVEQALAGFDAPLARLQVLGADPADPVPPVEPV